MKGREKKGSGRDATTQDDMEIENLRGMEVQLDGLMI